MMNDVETSIGSLPKILMDETRSGILLALNEREPLAYVQLQSILGIEHTGKLNYHLKTLGDLLGKDAEGRYVLSEKGKVAVGLLMNFERAELANSQLRSKFEDAARWSFWGMECFVAQPVAWMAAWAVTTWEDTIISNSLSPWYSPFGFPTIVFTLSLWLPSFVLAVVAKVKVVDPLRRQEAPRHIRRWSVSLSLLGVFYGFGIAILVMGWADEKIKDILKYLERSSKSDRQSAT
jgi:hypothetical protein